MWTYTTTSVLIFLFDKKAAISVADPWRGSVGGLEPPSVSNIFLLLLDWCWIHQLTGSPIINQLVESFFDGKSLYFATNLNSRHIPQWNMVGGAVEVCWGRVTELWGELICCKKVSVVFTELKFGPPINNSWFLPWIWWNYQNSLLLTRHWEIFQGTENSLLMSSRVLKL